MDATPLPRLVEQATSRLDGRIVEVLTDGAYDMQENFDFLKERNIDTVIHMRKNANMKCMGGTSARRWRDGEKLSERRVLVFRQGLQSSLVSEGYVWGPQASAR